MENQNKNNQNNPNINNQKLPTKEEKKVEKSLEEQRKEKDKIFRERVEEELSKRREKYAEELKDKKPINYRTILKYTLVVLISLAVLFIPVYDIVILFVIGQTLLAFATILFFAIMFSVLLVLMPSLRLK